MGILDQIANPKIPSFLDNLKVMDDIEQRKTNRMLAEVQAGQYLQNLTKQRQLAEEQRKGTQLISQYLQPKTATPSQAIPSQAMPQTAPQQQTFLEKIGTPKTPEIPETIALPSQEKQQEVQQQQALDIASQIPVNTISEAQNLNDLADKLAAIPAMQPFSKFIYGLADQTLEHVRTQTKEQRQLSEKLFELTGANFRQVAKLEQSGHPEQAKELFNQTRDFILSDERFNKDPNVQKFYTQFKDYKPGLGNYIYLATQYSAQARNALNKTMAGGQTFRETGADGYTRVYNKADGSFIDYARDEKGNPIKAFAAGKEEHIQARFEERQTQIAKRDEFTHQKFNVKSTFDILKYKRQEEKDLQEAKNSIERAKTLAKEGKNLALVDKLLKQGVSKWENTSVRAYAELEQFRNYGDIVDRLAGTLSQFGKGEMTARQRQMLLETGDTLLKNFINPQLQNSNTYWRRIGAEQGLDPDQIGPYKTKEEVGQDLATGTIDEQTAIKILQKPRFK